MDKIRRFRLTGGTASPVYGLGILTDEADYRICWLLNQAYAWDLVRSADLQVQDKSGPIQQLFSCFESRTDHQPAIRLISNRSREGLWLTEFRQVDYILITSLPGDSGAFIDELKTSIATKIPQIRGLFKLPLPSFCYL